MPHLNLNSALSRNAIWHLTLNLPPLLLEYGYLNLTNPLASGVLDFVLLRAKEAVAMSSLKKRGTQISAVRFAVNFLPH